MSKPGENQVRMIISRRPKLLAAVAVVLALAFVGLGIGFAGCSSGGVAGGASNARAIAEQLFGIGFR